MSRDIATPGAMLHRPFFARDPDTVARELIGARLVVRSGGGATTAMIVETEAYGGDDDAASHAYRDPTPRCAVMFGPAGHLYVYRSYGIHWCMNVVTGEEGRASAVLLRAAVTQLGSDDQDEGESSRRSLSGPGNLTKGLGITGDDGGVDVCAGPLGRIHFQGRQAPIDDASVRTSPRIGISRERERMSRYFLGSHPAVSPRRTVRARVAS